MPDERTTINVSSDTWKRLLVRKSPGDTFDDVLTAVLDDLEACQERVTELEEQLEDLREE